ncbi:MAG: nucleotide sugar dehydrogenase [Woeseiaceae bacterium]|nr:nucleotide sugar dehydrogenase [Woeseiaceae bacterium]
MKISIFGLGYVGAVSLACLSRDGHEVTGVDIDTSKLDLISSGKSPVVEEGILELMEEVAASGRVSVTSDAGEAIQATELSFVCVGTPSLPNGGQDLTALKRLSKQLGEALAAKDDSHIVVIRSTVEPGTVESVVIPLLEEHSGKKADEDFHVCFQPEFLREGSSIRDYDNPPMTVVGVRNDSPLESLRSIFGNLACKFIPTDIRTAETLKYACNTYHSLKITFANEIGRICQAIGSDSLQVMELLCEDKQLNISKAYLRPGFAFGGSCLPKDLRALLYLGKMHDVETPMLSGVLPSNRVHVEHALKTILERGDREIGVVGLSFKSGTDDLRESPLVDLVERLIGKGINLRIYDPEVRVSRLIGANKAYIENVVPHIGSLMCDSVETAIDGAGTVIVGLSGDDIVSSLVEHCVEEQFIVDLVGLDELRELGSDYVGACW